LFVSPSRRVELRQYVFTTGIRLIHKKFLVNALDHTVAIRTSCLCSKGALGVLIILSLNGLGVQLGVRKGLRQVLSVKWRRPPRMRRQVPIHLAFRG
jgi:hypothetical protein